MRALALWAVLFAAYAATLGVNAVGGRDYGGDEPRYLLVAESMVSDRDIDLTDEFATRAYADFHAGPLPRQGQVILGRSMEPQGIGFALLIAPAYALGGANAVELFLAAITALGFVLAAAVARRMVPEPWASGAALLVGLSPLALAHATAVYPEAAAGTALAGAALCALRVRERPALRQRGRRRGAARRAAVAGAEVPAPGRADRGRARALDGAPRPPHGRARGGRDHGRLDRRLRDDQRPPVRRPDPVRRVRRRAAARPARTRSWEHVERLPRLAGLWIDRDVGLLRWAPVLALSVFAAWLLWRSRRAHLARLVEARADAEAAAELALAVWGAVLLVAAFAAPSIDGEWFAGRQLVAGLPLAAALCAWGLRHAPRTGAVLGALTLLGSLWLALAFAFGDAGGWADHGTDAPLGPAVELLPRSGSVWFGVVASVLAVALVAVVAREWWRERQLAAA